MIIVRNFNSIGSSYIGVLENIKGGMGTFIGLYSGDVFYCEEHFELKPNIISGHILEEEIDFEELI